MGGSRRKENYFVIPKVYHNVSYIQRISMISVQVNPWLCGYRTLLSGNFWKFLTWAWRSQSLKTAVFRYPAHSLQEQSFTANHSRDGKRIRNGCVLGSQPTRYLEPKRGTQTHKKFRFRKFISPILPDVENFAEINGTIIFQIRLIMEEIARKLLLRHGRLELTLVANTAR